jgi:hypothetical protein
VDISSVNFPSFSLLLQTAVDNPEKYAKIIPLNNFGVPILQQTSSHGLYSYSEVML